MSPPSPHANSRPNSNQSPAGACAILAVALGMLSSPACSSLDARVHNLGELHHDDGKNSYIAALMGEGEFLIRRAFRVSAPFGIEFGYGTKEPDFIEDPSSYCLRELLALERFPIKELRTLLLRTEMYAWLAIGDPYILARERCVLELGEIGRKLGVEQTIEAATIENPPTAEELSAHLAILIGASAPILSNGAASSEVSLGEACRNLEQIELDVTGGRRVLRACAVLLEAKNSDRSSFEPLRGLARSVASRLTAIALGEALRDESGVVRAAAIQAWTHSTNNRAGDILIEVLGDRDPEVLHRLCREILAHGLPGSSTELTAEQREVWRENWLANLVRMTVENVDGMVSVAACRALGKVSDAGFESLRFEEWYGWWQARTEALLDEVLSGEPRPDEQDEQSVRQVDP